MREADFDELLKPYGGRVLQVAMHPDDVTELNDGNPVPHTPDTPTIYHQKGIGVVLDPEVERNSVRILKMENDKEEEEQITVLDRAYHNHLEMYHKNKSGPPNTCPECGKPTYMEGNCLECRVRTQGQAIVNLRAQMDGHFHYIAPSSDGVPEIMTTITQYKVLGENEAMSMKMADGQYRYVMPQDGAEADGTGVRTEHYRCPNCGQTKEFELKGNECVDTPVVCVVCTPEKNKCPDCGSQLSYTGFDWFCVNCPWRSSPESEEKMEKKEVISKTFGKDGKGITRYVMDGNTSPDNEDGSRTEIYTCPNCGTQGKFTLTQNEGVSLPVLCTACVVEEYQLGDLLVRKSPSNMGGFDIFNMDGKFYCFFNEKGAIALSEWIERTHRQRDDLMSPGIGLGPKDEEGFQAFVTKHNHDDNEVHLDTCPGCRVAAGPSKPMASDGPGIRVPRPGEHVLYWDHDGVEHDALVIRMQTLSNGEYPILNIQFVDLERMTPNGYGCLIRRDVKHESVIEVHRNCWT